MQARRKSNTGLHRVKVPGHGWMTIRPGKMISSAAGKPLDFEDLSWLGVAIENYTVLGAPDPEEVEPVVENDVKLTAQKVEGGYNIVNVVTGKALNDKPVTREDAKKFAPDIIFYECMIKDGEFGVTFADLEECEVCPLAEPCGQAAGDE